MRDDLWTFPPDYAHDVSLDGFDVHAEDGDIGSVDEATDEVGAAYIVVDTGPWIFGRKVLIPAGAIHRIDLDERSVHLALTKDQIKGSPEYDEQTMARDESYRTRLGDYYGPYYDGGEAL